MSYSIYIILILFILLLSIGIIFKKKTKTPIFNDVHVNTWTDRCPEGFVCEYHYERNQYLIKSKIN